MGDAPYCVVFLCFFSSVLWWLPRKLKTTRWNPTLAALAGIHVIEGMFQNIFVLINVSNGELTCFSSSTEMEVHEEMRMMSQWKRKGK